MVKAMFILAVMFLLLFIIDIIIIITAKYINNLIIREKTITIFGIKASIMCMVSVLCLIVTCAIQFGW